MEEACAKGDLESVKSSFQSMLLNTDTAIPLRSRLMPGANGVIRRSITRACSNGHATVLSYLLDQGIDTGGDVAAAVFAGNDVTMCQALIDHGWEPRVDTVDISSVLNNEVSLKFILEHGWNPNQYHHSDVHPLTVAASKFPVSTVKILLEHGVSSRGTQAMHFAANMAAIDPTRFEVLDLLLQYDGDVNEMEVDPKALARNPPRQRTGYTGTPLHRAMEQWHGGNCLDTVIYLLEKGADPMAPSWSGKTALQVAERGVKLTEVAAAIRKWGLRDPPNYNA